MKLPIVTLAGLLRREGTMAQCERLEGCPFFKNIKHLPKTAEQLVTTYCRGDSSGCARRWGSACGIRPPNDLFPNERDRALVILAESGKPPSAFLDVILPKSGTTR